MSKYTNSEIEKS